MDVQGSGKVPGDRRALGAGDERDLTQFVTSHVRRVINPSETGIHHRDQPELGFGKGPIFEFSRLNPAGPTLGTISASHPSPPPWHRACGTSTPRCSLPKNRAQRGKEIIPSPSELPKYPVRMRSFALQWPLPWLFNTCKAKQKKPAQKMLRPNPGSRRHRGGSRWNQ